MTMNKISTRFEIDCALREHMKQVHEGIGVRSLSSLRAYAIVKEHEANCHASNHGRTTEWTDKDQRCANLEEALREVVEACSGPLVKQHKEIAKIAIEAVEDGGPEWNADLWHLLMRHGVRKSDVLAKDVKRLTEAIEKMYELATRDDQHDIIDVAEDALGQTTRGG